MHYRLQFFKQFRYHIGGTVQPDLMRQFCKLVQVVGHSYKVAHGGDFLHRMLCHNLRLECGIPDVFGKRPIGLSATKAQTVVIRFGKFYRNGLGEFAEAACSRSPVGLDCIAIPHFTWFIVITHFIVMMYLTICDHWERIASTTSGVERGFSGAMAVYPTFFGIPKDNLAPFHKQKSYASAYSRMPDSSNAECRYIFHRIHVIIFATVQSLLNRFQDVAGRCFQAIPIRSFYDFRACVQTHPVYRALRN